MVHNMCRADVKAGESEGAGGGGGGARRKRTVIEPIIIVTAELIEIAPTDAQVGEGKPKELAADVHAKSNAQGQSL